MGIKAVIASLDDVQDGLKEHYKETDGKYVLDVDGFDDHPTVRGVITANKTNKETRDKLRAENETLKERLKVLPEDFDPESYQDMVERFENNQAPDTEEKLAKLRAKLEEKHSKELGLKSDELSTLKSTVERMVVDDGLSKAMDDAQIDTLHKSKLLPFLKSVGKISVEPDGTSFKAVVDTDLGPVTMSQFVSDWAQSEDGKPYVAKSTGPKLRNGEGVKGNSITRSEFDAMDQQSRQSFVKEGGKVAG